MVLKCWNWYSSMIFEQLKCVLMFLWQKICHNIAKISQNKPLISKIKAGSALRHLHHNSCLQEVENNKSLWFLGNLDVFWCFRVNYVPKYCQNKPNWHFLMKLTTFCLILGSNDLKYSLSYPDTPKSAWIIYQKSIIAFQHF